MHHALCMPLDLRARVACKPACPNRQGHRLPLCCREYEGPCCAVCLADYEDGEVITTLPQCSHNFHQECITLWLSQHTTCPMCRTSLAPPPPPAAPPRPLQQLLRVSGSAGSASQPLAGGQLRTASAPLLLEPGQGGWPRLVLQPAASRQQSADLGSSSPSSTQRQQQEPLMQRDGSGQGDWQPSTAADPRRGPRWLLLRLSGSRRAWGSQARPVVRFQVFQPFNLVATPLQGSGEPKPRSFTFQQPTCTVWHATCALHLALHDPMSRREVTTRKASLPVILMG